jgi:hypothetical protein
MLDPDPHLGDVDPQRYDVLPDLRKKGPPPAVGECLEWCLFAEEADGVEGLEELGTARFSQRLCQLTAELLAPVTQRKSMNYFDVVT